MSFCEDCGKPRHEGARFCGACGAAVPEDKVEPEATAAEALPEPSAWSCPSCGVENGAEALFCSHCGARHASTSPPGGRSADAPTAVMAGAAAPQTSSETADGDVPEAAADKGGASDAGPRGRVIHTLRTPWVIALIVVLVVIAVAASVLVVVVSRGRDQQVSATFASQSQAIVTPLAPMVSGVASALPVSLAKCTWSTKLAPAVRSAEHLQTALVQSESDCAKLTSRSDAQASTKQALGKALGALATYAEAVAALPSQLSAVTPAQAQALHHAASAAQAACRQLRSIAAGLPPLAVGACAAIPAGARKARSDAALRLFLLRVQNDILNQSQYGRKDLVAAVGGVQGMTLNPDDAATTIDSVGSNRQSLLDQLSAMDVPNDRRATKLYDLLQQSLQHSIEADRYFAAWMHGVYNYYYAEPQGYLGNVPSMATTTRPCRRVP